MPKGFDLSKKTSFCNDRLPSLPLCRCQWKESGDLRKILGYKSNPSSLHMLPLLRTKLRRKGFDLKELNLAITDCPLDLSGRAPNQVPMTKCKEKFCKDLIAHFSFAPKRCRSIKVFLPFTNQNLRVSVSVPLQKLISPDHNKISLPTRISLYLYLFKNRSYPIKVKYLYQPESLSICICTSSKTDSTRSKSNIVRLHKFVWCKSSPALNITQTFGNLHSRY